MLRRGARGHARVPGLQVLALRVERLADRRAELEEREEQDVRQREAVAADELTPFDQAVELR